MDRKINTNTDREIQEALDNKTESFDSQMLKHPEDVELYRFLYNKLEETPQIDLGRDFVELTFTEAQRRKRMREFFWKVTLFVGLSIPLVALSIVVVFTMNSEIFYQMIGAIESNFTLIFFGIFLFMAIQTLDKKIIKSKLPDVRT